LDLGSGQQIPPTAEGKPEARPARTPPLPRPFSTLACLHHGRRCLPFALFAPVKSPGFFLLGATHRRTPLAVRERLALGPESMATLYGTLIGSPGLRELVILGTCNRVEFYGVADAPSALVRVEAAWCAQCNFTAAEFKAFRVALTGRDALQHLHEVAAGLDSQLIGETEILGQVKSAYADAHARNATGPVLNRIFQKSLQAAKHARSRTAITAGRLSLAQVAVDLAQAVIGDLATARILLLGAGEIGEQTARAFLDRGTTYLTVAGRHPARTQALATRLGATALPFARRETRLSEFDIIVGSTSAPGTVISAGAVATAVAGRPDRPLVFLDLALPRDIEPSVSGLGHVFLYNLDDLAQISTANRTAREGEVARARALLSARADALWSQFAPRTAPTAALPPSSENSPASG
jgi:glutamyl-tRNA reductase